MRRILLYLCLLLAGCSAGPTGRDLLSLVFDGVPAPVEPAQLCEDYAARQAAGDAELTRNLPRTLGSSHKPYAEKKCQDCHTSSKSVSSSLKLPKDRLCLSCHDGFITGSQVHGPVAVGDCLSCHLPHSSANKALLKKPATEICALCHQEIRLAAAMHDRFIQKKMNCGECHDPHSGNARYFLK